MKDIEKIVIMKMFKKSEVIEETKSGNKLLKSYRDDYIVTTANGKHWTQIDLEDWDLIKNHHWAECDGGYLRTTIPVDGRQTWKRMHSLIMPGGHSGMVVDHENRKKWDNRKANLVIKTIYENFQNSEHYDEVSRKQREELLRDRIIDDTVNNKAFWE